MPDLFLNEINDAIRAVQFDAGWAEQLNMLLKEKRRITRKTK